MFNTYSNHAKEQKHPVPRSEALAAIIYFK